MACDPISKPTPILFCNSTAAAGEDDSFVGAFDDGEAEVAADGGDEAGGVAGAEGAADGQVGQGFVGEDDAAAAVAVEFGHGFGQGVVLEDELAVAPAYGAVDVGGADRGFGGGRGDVALARLQNVRREA